MVKMMAECEHDYFVLFEGISLPKRRGEYKFVYCRSELHCLLLGEIKGVFIQAEIHHMQGIWYTRGMVYKVRTRRDGRQYVWLK